jgi:hypothetical protein
MKKTADLNLKIDFDLKEQAQQFADSQDDTNLSDVVRMALRVYLFLVKTRRLVTVMNWALETIGSSEPLEAA